MNCHSQKPAVGTCSYIKALWRYLSFLIALLVCVNILNLFPRAGGIALAGEARPTWQLEWDRTVEAAREEGQVNVYFRHSGPLKVFEEDYPGVKILSVTGRGSQIVQRILAERRAGKYLCDVLSSGWGTIDTVYRAKGLDPIKDVLVLPEVLDESKWWSGKHRYTDPEGKYIFTYLIKASTSQFHYNTNLVDPKEIQSFWDFLKPKWRGKIVSLYPEVGLQSTIQRFYYHPDLGPEFMRKFFGETDMTFNRDHRLMTDSLARGKFAICVGCRDVPRAKAAGLPVEEFNPTGWKEALALASSGGNLGLCNQAPHPNAAKVFINWYLSRKGQMAFQRLWDPDDPPNSRRLDISKDVVAPNQKLVPGRKYLDLEGKDIQPARKLVREILAKRRAMESQK